MQIIEMTSTSNITPDSAPAVLVIGKFDGVHKGHEAILRRARSYLTPELPTLAVLSFSQHPRWVLQEDPAFKEKITSVQDKMELLKAQGVSRIYEVEFTKEYAKITAETFILDHISKLNVKRIVVGEDFHFGRGGGSDTKELARLCAQIDIQVTVVPLVEENGRKLSSTTIRQFIQAGLMEPVQALLGRPYTMTGTVIHGQKLGRKLGFPTINLGGTDDYVKPKPGVYLGVVGIHNPNGEQEYWNVLISAGYRPTVDGEGYLVEGYILDFSGDLYDKTVSVSFLHYMREELKFDGLDSLIAQMEQDKAAAQKMFGYKLNTQLG